MDRLLTVNEIMERYKCSANTARSRMRKMVHMEKPLMVSERAVMDWEAGKTVYPMTKKPACIETEMKIPRRRIV